MDTCRDEILDGLKCVKIVGSPGRLLVFRMSAEAILSTDKPEDVIIAAAQLGLGRIVVFSHNSFGSRLLGKDSNDENFNLYCNIKKWVSNGKVTACDDNSDILTIDAKTKVNSIEELAKYSIIVYHTVASNYFNEKILDEFVKNGGGFVYAITPWGWLQCNSNKSLKQAPYVSILHEAGIGFSGDIANSREKIFLGRNKAHESHIMKTFHVNNFNLDMALDKVNLVTNICELPSDVCSELERSIKSCWGKCGDDIRKLFDQKPIKCSNIRDRGLLDMWMLGAEAIGLEGIKAHGIQHFPGDYEVLPPTSCGQFEYTSIREEFYHTSCYVPAAYPVLLEVVSVSPANCKWKAIIGSHVDVLTDVAVRRWPKVSYSYDLTDKTSLEISSPFGGLITLVSPNSTISSISLKISDYISSPMYNILDSVSVENWLKNRDLPGLWANISGKWVTITLPSSSIRLLDDPSPALRFFDELREAYHDLRGTDNDKFRREWIVADEQPCAGYMHAGYPIVTHLDVAQPSHAEFLLNGQHLRQEGSWGIFHEIGHNMQQGEWTFEGTSEVTVNIFTLYVMQTLCGKKAWVHEWLKPHVKLATDYLLNGASFDKWQSDPGIALIIYAQLANVFGWDTYKKVMRKYQGLKEDEKPRHNQDKIDLWFLIFSQEAGFNLHPMAFFWGIPISDIGEQKLKELNLQDVLFDDEVSKNVEKRCEIVKEKFPNIILKSVT